jgi:hypothetical protein
MIRDCKEGDAELREEKKDLIALTFQKADWNIPDGRLQDY